MSKIIVITGASTGIGAETAHMLAEGNNIFIHYNTSREAAKQTAAEVQERGGTAHLVQADLFGEAGCDALYSEVAVMTNRIDVLVNNAGGLVQRQAVGKLEWSLIERVFSLNTFSTMLLTSLFLPLLEKGTDPCIVNITSIVARHGDPGATIYEAAKGAIDSFTRGAAAELAPKIRVNAVAPGVIDTPFRERYTTPENMETFRKNTPVARIGRPTDVAKTVRFLIDNNFITGETIDVNGGLFMH
jgi:3-oxoacyl-[acyl-carrier protein] reductase